MKLSFCVILYLDNAMPTLFVLEKMQKTTWPLCNGLLYIRTIFSAPDHFIDIFTSNGKINVDFSAFFLEFVFMS